MMPHRGVIGNALSTLMVSVPTRHASHPPVALVGMLRGTRAFRRGTRAGRMIAEIVRERVGGLAAAVCTNPSGSPLTPARFPSPRPTCTARRFTRPARWPLPAAGFLNSAQIWERSYYRAAKGRARAIPWRCALGSLCGTRPAHGVASGFPSQFLRCVLQASARVARGSAPRRVSRGTHPHAALCPHDMHVLFLPHTLRTPQPYVL